MVKAVFLTLVLLTFGVVILLILSSLLFKVIEKYSVIIWTTFLVATLLITSVFVMLTLDFVSFLLASIFEWCIFILGVVLIRLHIRKGVGMG